MKKRLLLILATMGLAVGGLVGLSAAPASAHVFDTNAGVSCVVTEPVPAASWTLVHAHPLFLNESVVRYGCYATYGAGGSLDCGWEVLLWVNGTITGPYNITEDCA